MRDCRYSDLCSEADHPITSHRLPSLSTPGPSTTLPHHTLTHQKTCLASSRPTGDQPTSCRPQPHPRLASGSLAATPSTRPPYSVINHRSLLSTISAVALDNLDEVYLTSTRPAVPFYHHRPWFPLQNRQQTGPRCRPQPPARVLPTASALRHRLSSPGPLAPSTLSPRCH